MDATTGETLLEIDADDSYVSLSPDGRFAMASSLRRRQAVVYDVGSGSHVTVDYAKRGYGWSQDGQLFAVDGHQLTTCSPTTGACETADLDLVKEPQDSRGVTMKCKENGGCVPVGPPPDYSGELKLGGLVYES